MPFIFTFVDGAMVLLGTGLFASLGVCLFSCPLSLFMIIIPAFSENRPNVDSISSLEDATLWRDSWSHGRADTLMCFPFPTSGNHNENERWYLGPFL